jgi:type I restriction enzyme S subunit
VNAFVALNKVLTSGASLDIASVRTWVLTAAIGGHLTDTESGRWRVTNIASVCKLATGATPDSGRAEYYGGEIKWLRSGDINQHVILDCEGRITEAGLANSNCKILQPNSVLIALNGQGKTRGSVALLRTAAACNQSLVAMTPTVPDELSPEYLYWNLRSRYQEVRDLTGKEGDRRGLNMKIVGALPISIPPPAEQQRIVEKVDELMAACDQLEAAQEERERQMDRLSVASLDRLTAMAETSEGTAYKDVTFFLAHSSRIITKPGRVADVRRAILSLAVQGRLADTSTEWESTRVGDLCELVTSGSRGWADYYSPSGAYFLRAQNVRFGYLRLEYLAHVSPPKGGEGTRTRIMTNDIVVVITGAGVTNPALIDIDLGEAYVSQHLGLMRLRNPAYSRWMLLWLMAEYGARNELIERAYGAGKPGLNLNNLRTLPILVPELPEQERIVAKVDELMAVCDELEGSLEAAQAGRTRALEAVLHWVLEEAGCAFA